jgi:hypothetical protein
VQLQENPNVEVVLDFYLDKPPTPVFKPIPKGKDTSKRRSRA